MTGPVAVLALTSIAPADPVLGTWVTDRIDGVIRIATLIGMLGTALVARRAESDRGHDTVVVVGRWYGAGLGVRSPLRSGYAGSLMTKSRMLPTRRSKLALACGVILGLVLGLVAERYGAGDWGKALAATAGFMLGLLVDRENFYGAEPRAKRRLRSRN